MPWTSEHIKWLVDTDERLKTSAATISPTNKLRLLLRDDFSLSFFR